MPAKNAQARWCSERTEAPPEHFYGDPESDATLEGSRTNYGVDAKVASEAGICLGTNAIRCLEAPKGAIQQPVVLHNRPQF